MAALKRRVEEIRNLIPQFSFNERIMWYLNWELLSNIFIQFLFARPAVLEQFAVLAQKFEALHNDLDPLLMHFVVHPKQLAEETNKGAFELQLRMQR